MGEEVKKGPEHEPGGRDEREFPLVLFLRRLSQIPTPPGPYFIPAKQEVGM